MHRQIKRLLKIACQHPKDLDRSGLHNRTVFNTGAAARAQIHVNGPGALFNLDCKVSGFALNRFKICVCD